MNDQLCLVYVIYIECRRKYKADISTIAGRCFLLIQPHLIEKIGTTVHLCYSNNIVSANVQETFSGKMSCECSIYLEKTANDHKNVLVKYNMSLVYT